MLNDYSWMIFLVSQPTCNFIKKEILAQVFSCESSEIFKNTFFYKIPPVAGSVCLFFTVVAVGRLFYTDLRLLVSSMGTILTSITFTILSLNKV